MEIKIDGNKIVVPDGYSIRQVGNVILFEPKEEKVKNWDDLRVRGIKGYYIGVDCEIKNVELNKVEYEDREIARTEAHCKAMLAMAQISQLKPFYGGDITEEEWSAPSVFEATIYYDESIKDFAVSGCTMLRANPLVTFRSREQAEEFIKHNRNLLIDYFMIEQE